MKYKCSVCGYVYDDEKEAKQFNELEEDWICPICNVSKKNFYEIK